MLIDLYVKRNINKSLQTGVSRNVNSFKPRSRYNELNISKKILEIIDKLEENNLIHQVVGFNDRHSGIGRTTRIWPTAKLSSMFSIAKFGPEYVKPHPDREVIVLRDIDPDTGKQFDKEYDDTHQIESMRSLVRDYNDLLSRTFIDIPVLDQSYIDLGKGIDGRVRRLYVNQGDKFTRRIFNRGSFDKGGRFWGGWWQRSPKEWRHQIFMNDQPISEVDYSGLHLVMLYAWEGIDYWNDVGKDPYQIDVKGYEDRPDEARSLCKSLILVALNAANDRSAFQAFRSDAEAGSPEKKMTDAELAEVLNELKRLHKPVAGKFASDAGIDLMNLDAKITEEILSYFVNQDIPVLSIHDSYLVPMGMEKLLKEQMQTAFGKVMGIPNVRLKKETHNPWDYEALEIEDTSMGLEMAPVHRSYPDKTKRYKTERQKFCRVLGR